MAQSKAVHRLGDQCSGHGCFPPRVNIEGSPDVFVNDIAVHRQGDAWAVHVCGEDSHAGTLEAGSLTVFANNKQLGRIGDLVDTGICGSAAAEGSSDVFSGD